MAWSRSTTRGLAREASLSARNAESQKLSESPWGLPHWLPHSPLSLFSALAAFLPLRPQLLVILLSGSGNIFSFPYCSLSLGTLLSCAGVLNPINILVDHPWLRLSLLTTLCEFSLFPDPECPQTSKLRSKSRSILPFLPQRKWSPEWNLHSVPDTQQQQAFCLFCLFWLALTEVPRALQMTE